ncbi:MAG: hypothetical protein DBX37_04870 [Massilioclostridium sp.]|nr:MAG: hypothetical protein DBX37_04870 [Massilioclostridium sp.]
MKSEINLKDLPMGLGMALAQNTDAMKKFVDLSKPEQAAIIGHTHSIHSKQEMHDYINQIFGAGL